MQISIDTSMVSKDELTALIALCASLGGRLPSVTVSNISPVYSNRELAEMAVALVGPEDDVPPPPTEGNEPAEAPKDLAEPVARTTSDPVVPSDVPELDADGIPWDERIHASTKTKTQAGVWTKKRKVDEVEYGRIHAELQEQYAGNEDVPPPPATQDTTAENAPTDDTDVPPPPAQDAPAASDDFADFAALVQAVSPLGLAYVKLAELTAQVTDGLATKFPDLKELPDYWPAFYKAALAAK